MTAVQIAITAFFVLAGGFAIGVIAHSGLKLWRYYRATKDNDNG